MLSWSRANNGAFLVREFRFRTTHNSTRASRCWISMGAKRTAMIPGLPSTALSRHWVGLGTHSSPGDFGQTSLKCRTKGNGGFSLSVLFSNRVSSESPLFLIQCRCYQVSAVPNQFDHAGEHNKKLQPPQEHGERFSPQGDIGHVGTRDPDRDPTVPTAEANSKRESERL